MNQKVASFRFYEELNDFLPPAKKKKHFDYRFNGRPSIKDAIEAIGVPHTEVDLILVNGQSVDFNHHLQDEDRVSVYPVFESLDITPVVRLREEPLRKTAFVLDTQLGKLTKLLRLLGFDTLYRNDYEDSEIIRLALEEERIILTRDIGLLKNKSVTHGIWIRSTSPEEQLKEVLHRFDLYSQIKPFQRCSVCNGTIGKIDKKEIIDQLPTKTKLYYDDFYRCQECGKIYWKGSHYQRMKVRISGWMKESADKPE